MHLSFIPYTLNFRFPAGTSRGILLEKTSWIIVLRLNRGDAIAGLGECGPIPGLSPDDRDLGVDLSQLALDISELTLEQMEVQLRNGTLINPTAPSVIFGLETALLDLKSGGQMLIYNNAFSRSEVSIPINGLVWMGTIDFMEQQIQKKIEEGFRCIKIKVGAIELETEFSLLKKLREKFNAEEVTLRLDANGAFSAKDALEILKRFSAYDIHSIEQPIRAGQWQEMAELCENSPIDIALDEELIGIYPLSKKKELINTIQPRYIILKPGLMGGLKSSAEWIQLAENAGSEWWITSALESNIGLNAIAQFTANYEITLPQGLGTGQLYHNNIASPLIIQNGMLYYDASSNWDNQALKKPITD
ncbi:MAG: o-succinylbenzoate synthase [Cyclobacteriaceae bacterium]|nr:o-succinylbenzoate synthase [Cyclobacteriaceae bacterium]